MSHRAGLFGLVAIALLAGCATTGTPIAASSEQLEVVPGEPIIQLLGEPETHEFSSDSVLDLREAPAAATHVRVTVTCTAPGTTWYGPDAGGNNPSQLCTDRDIATSADTGWMDFALGSGNELFIALSDGAASTITLQFASHTPTDFGVNADGATFGGLSSAAGEEPDLAAVYGTDADGESVFGYVWSSDLTGFGPDWPGLPSNPDEALAWQAERDARYPDGWDIPVYESDGRTVIGTFRVTN